MKDSSVLSAMTFLNELTPYKITTPTQDRMLANLPQLRETPMGGRNKLHISITSRRVRDNSPAA